MKEVDIPNPESLVIKRCIEITHAEFGGRLDETRTLSLQAWEAVTSNYEACIAAHYVALYQTQPEEIFHWNRLALKHTDACERWQVEAFYPSLYVNMGYAFEQMGEIRWRQRNTMP